MLNNLHWFHLFGTFQNLENPKPDKNLLGVTELTFLRHLHLFIICQSV